MDEVAAGGGSASRLAGRDAASGVEVLCRAQWKPMVRLSYLLCGDREGAEDVVQDAFVALSRRWEHLRSPDAAAAYLRTTVVNGTRSAMRRRVTARRLLHPVGDERVEAAESTAVRNDEQRRVLLLSEQEWSDWSEFLQDGPLPVQPQLPVMLRRLGTASHRLVVMADQRDARA